MHRLYQNVAMLFNVRWERGYLNYVNKKKIKSFLFVDSVGFDCISMLRFGFLWHSGSTGVSAFKKVDSESHDFLKMCFRTTIVKSQYCRTLTPVKFRLSNFNFWWTNN